MNFPTSYLVILLNINFVENTNKQEMLILDARVSQIQLKSQQDTFVWTNVSQIPNRVVQFSTTTPHVLMYTKRLREKFPPSDIFSNQLNRVLYDATLMLS